MSKNFLRFLAISTVILLLTFSGTSLVFAAASPVTLSTTATGGIVGQVLDVPIYVDQAGITNFDLPIFYDPAKLRPSAILASSIIQGFSQMINLGYASNEVYINGASLTPTTTSGAIVTLQFDVLEAGPTTLSLDMDNGSFEGTPISGVNAFSVTLNNTAALSSVKDITGFSFEGLTPAVTGVITGTNIDATVPAGTNVTALVPTITVSADATVTPVSTVAQNFTNPVTYVVTASDGTTKSYTVTVTTAAALSTAKIITGFSFVSPVVTGTITTVSGNTGSSIAATVPFGTNVTALVPTIEVSPDATILPTSLVAQDFTSPVTYAVKAQNGTTKSYTVTVTVAAAPLSSAKDITEFSFAGLSSAVPGTITGTNISATVPAGTSVTALIPSIVVSSDATVLPASGAPQNFASPVTFVVKGQDGTTQTYTVTVSVATVPVPVQGPSFQNATLDTTNKVVTLAFDKPLTSNVTDLKSAIKLTTNGTTFSALGVSDSVSFNSDGTKLIVTFYSPLTGANNKLQIAANSLKDASGNVQTAVVTTPAISGSIDECFIATAAYGSISQQPVMLLRHFRDKFLLSNSFGQSFVKFYYHNSPPVARFIAGNEFLKLVVRVILTPAIFVAYLLFHPVLGITFIMLLVGIVYMRRNRRKRLLHV